jgi:hypothetical protein
MHFWELRAVCGRRKIGAKARSGDDPAPHAVGCLVFDKIIGIASKGGFLGLVFLSLFTVLIL